MDLISKLERAEQLELQNIMLRMALEQERITKYKRLTADAQDNFMMAQAELTSWNKKFSKEKLEPIGLDLTKIIVDADTGVISRREQEAP